MLYRHSLQCWRIYRRHRRRVYQLQIHWLSIIHQYWSISGLSYKCFIAPCQRNYNCGGVIQSSKICQHAEMSWVVKESELLRDAVELRPPPPTMCSLCVTWVKLCQTTFWFLKVQFVTWPTVADIYHDRHNQRQCTFSSQCTSFKENAKFWPFFLLFCHKFTTLWCTGPYSVVVNQNWQISSMIPIYSPGALGSFEIWNN